MASDYTGAILDALSQSDGPIQTSEAFPAAPFSAIKASLDRLKSRDYVTYQTLDKEEYILSEEAEEIARLGSHEARVFFAIKAVGELRISDLPSHVGKESAKFGQGKAFAAKWIKKDDKDKNILRPLVEEINDGTRDQLKILQTTKTHDDPKVIAELKKRKLISPQKTITFEVAKGPKYAKDFVKEETDLTADMLATGAWKTVKLKPYNFQALGTPAPSGSLHPLMKVRHEFRQIFFEMGFVEMPTSNFVESAFHNFEALFVPQQHPARDQQDTFFISDPPKADRPRAPNAGEIFSVPEATPTNNEEMEKKLDYERYWNDVRAVHENGKFGSIGYRYKWKEEEALRLVLRTHTTATSAYMLHQLAANPRPARYFSIDRVFRNESVDATHLAEFHQVEGVIADFGLTLGGLIGFMEIFFAKMGIHNLRFKPAYNPYTEPSMELFSWHSGFKKWVEIGNSGMFRPEMLQAMGLPADLRVYGWGLSLERPTMIKYGLTNIRDLVGHRVDLSFVETNPATRLEKD